MEILLIRSLVHFSWDYVPVVFTTPAEPVYPHTSIQTMPTTPLYSTTLLPLPGRHGNSTPQPSHQL